MDLLEEELLKEAGDSLNAIFGPLDLPVPGHGGESGGLTAFAFHVPEEPQVVGEDQIIERSAVAPHLLGPLSDVQARAHVFGLDVADWRVSAGDDVIGCAAFHAPGLIDRQYPIARCLKQVLQSRAVGMLGRRTC